MQKGKKIFLLEKIDKKKNFFIFIFLVVYIAGYLFFFTSKSWLNLKGDLIRPTKLNYDISWQDRKISLISWNYSKNQRMMEIIISIDNNSFDGISKYKFSSVDRSIGKLNTSEFAGNDELAVVRITDIKDSWSEISLRMDLDQKHHDSTYQTLKLYTNKYDVAETENIKDQSLNSYLISNIDNQIKVYQSEIKSMKKNIAKDNQTIANCNQDIKNLKDKEMYQTDDEKKDTDNVIANANTKISDLQNEISSLKSSISEYQQRIENLNQKKQTYN